MESTNQQPMINEQELSNKEILRSVYDALVEKGYNLLIAFSVISIFLSL